MHPVQQWLASDALLALLLLGVLSAAFIWLMPLSGWRETLRAIRGLRPKRPGGPFALETAALAYHQYEALATRSIGSMRAAYGRLARAHKRIGYELGYPRKLDRLAEATRVNAGVTAAVAQLAADELGVDVLQMARQGSALPPGSLNRTREALRHFVRDWSDEGREERARIFGPILEVFREVPRDSREGMRVLVPGSGLGRLAWEISDLGFTTTANELSFFMNLALRFLLSPDTTSSTNQHTVHPYAHWFSHQRTAADLFRSVTFPDALPRLSPSFSVDERDFMTLRAPPRDGAPEDDDAGYDVVVTLFFIDTSLNAVATLEHIYALLRPGGTWINLGPLLWTGGAEAALELSLEEVLALAREVGFTVERSVEEGGEGTRARRTVECEYTADQRAMMRWIYQAEFWVARK